MPTLPHVAGLPGMEGFFYESYGDPTAPTILCLHGFSLRGDVFERLVAQLTPQYHILAPDLRGCGRSAAMPGPLTVARYAEDAVALLDWLELPEATILGYSMGGIIAQTMARRHPDRVSELILVSTWAYKSQTPFEVLENYFGPAIYRSVGNGTVISHLSPGLLERMGFGSDPEMYDWYVEVLKGYNDRILLAQAEEIFSFDSRLWLRKLLLPTLVVTGTQDVIVPPYHATMLTHGIPNAELAVVEGAGHAVAFAQPAELARHIRTFLHR